MKRWFKFPILLITLLLSFSLIGCGTAAESSKEQKQDSKTTTKAAKSETKKKQPEETTNAATVNKPEQAAAQVITGTQKTQTVQTPAPSSTVKTNTNTPTNNKSTAVAASTPPPPTTVPASSKPVAAVTLSVVGPKELKTPTLMGATKVSVEDGDTIFTVLKRQKNLVVDSKGSGASTYIEGINNIYEFDYGQKSGWVFKVNGQSITKSVGIVTVKEGDRIECLYTE